MVNGDAHVLNLTSVEKSDLNQAKNKHLTFVLQEIAKIASSKGKRNDYKREKGVEKSLVIYGRTKKKEAAVLQF